MMIMMVMNGCNGDLGDHEMAIIPPCKHNPKPNPNNNLINLRTKHCYSSMPNTAQCVICGSGRVNPTTTDWWNQVMYYSPFKTQNMHVQQCLLSTLMWLALFLAACIQPESATGNQTPADGGQRSAWWGHGAARRESDAGSQAPGRAQQVRPAEPGTLTGGMTTWSFTLWDFQSSHFCSWFPSFRKRISVALWC